MENKIKKAIELIAFIENISMDEVLKECCIDNKYFLSNIDDLMVICDFFNLNLSDLIIISENIKRRELKINTVWSRSFRAKQIFWKFYRNKEN